MRRLHGPLFAIIIFCAFKCVILISEIVRHIYFCIYYRSNRFHISTGKKSEPRARGKQCMAPPELLERENS